MRSISPITSVFVVCFIILTGCSHSENPVTPDSQSGNSITGASVPGSYSADNRYIWGIWDVIIDPVTESAQIIPSRSAEMHLNAVRMLQETMCSDCLRIENIVFSPPNEVTADLLLRHPYPGQPKFTAFDVRGIFISGADYTFPATGRSISWTGEHPRMLNYDGYTTLFNPTEYPETLPVPPALKYHPGYLAPGGDLSSTLNPYVAYSVDEPRRMFAAGSSQTRNVRLRITDEPLEFGYAIDAC